MKMYISWSEINIESDEVFNAFVNKRSSLTVDLEWILCHM